MRRPHPKFALVLTLALGVGVLLWPVHLLVSENFVFYLPRARHVVPLAVIENSRYLPLVQVLNLVGTVSGLQEKRNSLKVWVGDSELELRLNDKKVRTNKAAVKLSAPARLVNGQWMVPSDFLTLVLPTLTQEHIEYQAGTDRAFIGNVQPISFSVRLDQVVSGARLTLQFTDKVKVQTASVNGKWVVYLGDQPVAPAQPSFHFQNPYVISLQFDDQDGVPKVIITPTSGGLNFYPSLTQEEKVLMADVLQPTPVVVQQRQTSQQPEAVGTAQSAAGPATAPGAAGAPGPQGQTLAPPPGPPLPALVLDPGHGGSDSGARSQDGVVEKDLVAQLVERVRVSLIASKKYRVVLTRTGDADPSFDEREVATNVARPTAFLTFHAGDLGASSPRVRVYTYLTSSPPPPQVGARLFTPWGWAQQAHLQRSHKLATLLEQRLSQVAGLDAKGPVEAPVRQLRSVDAPAVAIEVGTLSPAADAGSLTNASFQSKLADAVAQAVAAFREGD